jgi:hypothetical protein
MTMKMKYVAVALFASLFTILGYTKEPVMSNTKTYCVGRFLVDLPADAEVNGEAYQYLFGRIDSQRTGMDAQSFSADMEKRVAVLKATDENKGRTLKSVVTSDPTARALVTSQKLFGKSNYGFEAYWLKDHHLFTLKTQDMDEAVFRERVLPRLTNELLPNLRARKADEVPAQPGFCLKDGFIANDGSGQQFEDAGISFKFAQWPGVLVSVRTMTVTKVGEPTLLQRMDSGSVPAAFANLVGQIKTLRRGKRDVNGRQGEEILETVPAEGGYHLHQFRWEAQGTGVKEPLKPTLIVEFESGMTSVNGDPVRPKLTDDQAIAVFDAVANSLHIRPVGDVKTGEADQRPTLPLGALAQTGSVCPQTGWWTCPEASSHELEGGGRQHFAAGTVLPAATVLGTPTLADRIRGRQPRHALNTTWRLVGYDAGQIDSKGASDS